MRKSSGDTDQIQENEGSIQLGRRRLMTMAGAGLAAAPLFGAMSSASAQTPGGTSETNTNIGESTIGNGPYLTEGMAAYSKTGLHRPMKLNRRALGPKDVAVQIHYCGICHSDIHTIHEDWGKTGFPLITGHEVAGVVVATGSSVSKHRLGDRVGVGPMVNSCRHCGECESDLEQYCEGLITSYGSKDLDGTITQGGYSRLMVVDEDFVLKIPSAMDLAQAGPLLCAGVTVYSPLRRWSIGPGQKVGVIGFGGLGHIAVKLADALGAEVTVFTTSPEKVADAKHMGGKEVVVYKDNTDLSKYKRTFHFILDTAPYAHNLDMFIDTLKRDGTLCRVGVGKLTTPNEAGQMMIVTTRKNLAGSMLGSVRETQELLDFCATRNIYPEVTKIPMNNIDAAWANVIAKKARYRYVIDFTSPKTTV
ncbi:NAD(P)-dependent alcohol dehydrogenase [Burkholderia aenigmatica]|uniref:NAD(P)-dependent alcohol dehydrogenase n=1 Tax=Burkholderia aenigmatica TaxID=2015348 RepID=UPI0026507E8F|nr:NAD(P)-dependent alcohol dehydrogenase [Burkholderia aenigmatica]MDN7874895.1 NAD(P)-dependent alcohol dehydrogenase [Burkholderia aenigmatica]